MFPIVARDEECIAYHCCLDHGIVFTIAIRPRRVAFIVYHCIQGHGIILCPSCHILCSVAIGTRVMAYSIGATRSMTSKILSYLQKVKHKVFVIATGASDLYYTVFVIPTWSMAYDNSHCCKEHGMQCFSEVQGS